MNAKNKVIAGAYNGKMVDSAVGKAYIITKFMKQVNLDSTTVESYEVLNNEQSKSMGSGIAKGIVGGALFGVAGAVAGGMAAKTNGIYQISIQFNDGKKSLLEVDEKVYKAIIQSCF